MKVQKIRFSDQRISWIVLDDDLLPIKPIAAFLRYLDNLECSHNTLRAYANHLKHFWEYLKQSQKTWDAVQLDSLAEFISWLRVIPSSVIPLHGQESKRMESTINAMLTAIGSFYQFHELLGNTTLQLTRSGTTAYRRYKPLLHHISKSKPTKNRLIKLKEPKHLPKTLSHEQVERLFQSCNSLRDQFLIALLYESGMRIGQALGLHHVDIKSWDNEIHIEPRTNNINGMRAKTRSPYVIHVTAELMHLYAEYLIKECQDVTNDYVFIQTRGIHVGKPLNYPAVRDLFNRLSKKIGVRVTPHMLRHTHATALLRDGWDCTYIQKRLGHASVQTTLNTYTHLNNEDLKQAFKKYEKTKKEINYVARSK